jgi:DNA-repair protein XRCC1
MKNVVFVLSGFQNPLRSELRNKATMMGAIYNDDWDETCTHLMYVLIKIKIEFDVFFLKF